MPEPKPIRKPKQLFVEGRDAEEFFMALLRNMGLMDEVQVQNFGGINDLPGFLQAVRSASSVQGTLVPDIVSVGIHAMPKAEVRRMLSKAYVALYREQT